ncbi:hypothetical protein ACFSQ7_19360 [Paenibacillus rhizoplanae]
MPLFPAIQNPYELREFLELVQKRKPKTVVEIGTAGGGVFYSLCQLADANARLISIDYPGGPYGGGQDEYEVQLYSGFGAPGQQLSFIRDRSFHHSTKQDLIRLLGGTGRLICCLSTGIIPMAELVQTTICTASWYRKEE